MIFAKLDVCVWRHERFIEAGPAAAGYWMAALARLREDSSSTGFITPIAAGMLLKVGDRVARQLSKRLVDVGLFEARDGGHVLIGYALKNETKEQIEARRADTRGRVDAHRAAKRSGNGVHAPKRNALPPMLQASPVPGSDSDSDSDSVRISLSAGSPKTESESAREGVLREPETRSETRMLAAPPTPTIAPTPRRIDPQMPLPPEARTAAEMRGLQRVDDVWLDFVADRIQRGSLSCDFVAGDWPKWVSKELTIQRRERDRDATAPRSFGASRRSPSDENYCPPPVTRPAKPELARGDFERLGVSLAEAGIAEDAPIYGTAKTHPRRRAM